MTDKELKQWLISNLELSHEYDTAYGPERNQVIGLKFKNEDKPFTTITVYVENNS